MIEVTVATLDPRPLIAILRGLVPEEAVEIGEAIADAGFLCLEVPLNSPRPLESIALLRKALDAPTDEPGLDVLPEGFSARTRVHEYGGLSWVAVGDRLLYAQFDDQRLRVVEQGRRAAAPQQAWRRSR